MKVTNFKNLCLLSMTLALMSNAYAVALTDEMAFEEGMTPLEEVGMDAEDLSGIMNFNRSEYVTTIPSLEDIDNVVKSHRQVIVINKAAKGKDAQTMKVYQNGVVKPLFENSTVTKMVDGKKVKETIKTEKESVKISSGREKNEIAKSGREYFSTTPKGFFRPQRAYKMYYSNTWKADMPNAVFINCSRNDFNKECGIALHATSESHYAALGTRDSGGCIRSRLEVSEQIRKLVMDTGRGSDAGQFGIKNEGYRRDRIINNHVAVDLVDRDSGDIMNKKVNSWDTVIVVYE
jgi:hypothetical protein